MKTSLRRFKPGAVTRAAARIRRQLALYAVIGALAVTLDVVLFRALLHAAWPAPDAAAAAAAGALGIHFALNKYINFRRHDRPAYAQAGTYCAVTSVWWLLTLGVVALLTRGGAPPVIAKLLAVVVNFPLGFLAQRHLTFGVGIATVVRRARGTA